MKNREMQHKKVAHSVEFSIFNLGDNQQEVYKYDKNGECYYDNLIYRTKYLNF